MVKQLDPEQKDSALQNMVVIGHSQGGPHQDDRGGFRRYAVECHQRDKAWMRWN